MGLCIGLTAKGTQTCHLLTSPGSQSRCCFLGDHFKVSLPVCLLLNECLSLAPAHSTGVVGEAQSCLDCCSALGHVSHVPVACWAGSGPARPCLVTSAGVAGGSSLALGCLGDRFGPPVLSCAAWTPSYLQPPLSWRGSPGGKSLPTQTTCVWKPHQRWPVGLS